MTCTTQKLSLFWLEQEYAVHVNVSITMYLNLSYRAFLSYRSPVCTMFSVIRQTWYVISYPLASVMSLHSQLNRTTDLTPLWSLSHSLQTSLRWAYLLTVNKHMHVPLTAQKVTDVFLLAVISCLPSYAHHELGSQSSAAWEDGLESVSMTAKNW